MSSIYDDKKNLDMLDGGLTPSEAEMPSEQVIPNPELMQSAKEMNLPKQEEVKTDDNSMMQQSYLADYIERSTQAMKMVDDIVLKSYLTKLSDMEIMPLPDNMGLDEIVLYKINKMVYEKDEYATDKFISVISAMTYTCSSVFLIVDGQEDRTDFYIGIKCEDDNRTHSSVADTLRNSILGQFPGAILTDYSEKENDKKSSPQDHLLHYMTEDVSSISLCVGIPSYKNSKGEYTNANFIQGIEKFAFAMQGKRYTAVVLASNIPHAEIADIRYNYEQIYTELSAAANRQLAYSTNESLANAISRAKSTADTHTVSHAHGVGDGTTHNESNATTESTANTHTEGESKENWMGKIGKGLAMAGAAVAGVAVVAATGGAALPAVAAGAGLGVASAGFGMGAKTKNTSDSKTLTKSTSHTTADGVTHTETETTTISDAHTDSFSETNGTTSTIGSSKNFTITIQDKHILEIQKRIEKQLERMEICESTGIWATGAYFLSYGIDRSTAEMGASIFRSIMQGEQSGVENSAINTWYEPDPKDDVSHDEYELERLKFNNLKQYVGALSHPVFEYRNANWGTSIELLPTSLLNSKEVAIMIGLPRKSVPGLPVIEHVSLAKEVVRLNGGDSHDGTLLGCIFDQGVKREKNKVYLDIKSLTQHTFVTGATGSGKSNTVYYLISQLRKPDGPKFMVIEPAKGEYKDVLENVDVYGTNPDKTPLLRINPFRFPEGVHVLEHIDRLIEIFNVCWPMYAAMPAILKEAILNTYESCGWNLYHSKNNLSKELFPSFSDLLNELVRTISNSAYSDETKSNYTGALVSRVKSLCNGINQFIFSSSENGDENLFDKDVIIDLSRVGSSETKALIMGILIMRLNEYRANSKIIPNSGLRHITVLEEAHNIFRKTSIAQSQEDSNLAGKSVEMIANAIAEMRTYGEGFVIVDQSPNAVDASAIRNTNTKIIMRLPEDSDRQVAGKASALKDKQIDEIAKLPTGVAVVYQNDWEEPVLCQIEEYEGNHPYKFDGDGLTDIEKEEQDVKAKLVQFLLKGRVSSDIDIATEFIEQHLGNLNLPTVCKWRAMELLKEYREKETLRIWRDDHFPQLAKMVTEVLSLRLEVRKLIQKKSDFKELTEGLADLVQENLPHLETIYNLELYHCLMADYANESKETLSIYNAWLQTIKMF